MNVLIYPTYDPYGLALAIKHHNMAGNRTFVLKHSAVGAHHGSSAYWPAMLCKSSTNPTKRNVELHTLPYFDGMLYGEDYFLKNVELPMMYGDHVTCDFIDPATSRIKIDAFHTLRGGESYLKSVRKISRIYYPSARWISSTLDSWDHNPLDLFPTNVAKIIPANYADAYRSQNNFCMFADDFVVKELGARSQIDRQCFSCFNDYFCLTRWYDPHLTQYRMFKLFEATNNLLSQEMKIENFGGNAKYMGSDIRSSREFNPKNRWITLDPIQTAKKICSSRAVVILRDHGHGDKTFHLALATGTPVITTREFVRVSNSELYLRAGLNCILGDTPEELARAVKWLATDDEMFHRLSSGMELVKNSIFDDSYWTQWKVFLERVME